METAPLDNIRCPHCRHVIPISEMLSHQIAERARAQSKAEIEQLRTALAREQREIKEREKKVEVLVEKRVAAKVAKIEADAREKARGSVSLEIQDLKNQLAEVLKQRDAAQKCELEARKRARELDQRAKDLDLEAARKIDAERQKIQNEASTRAEERYQLKLAEKEKQIQDAKKANEELKRKLEQGSQQIQGEVMEIQLEETLRSAFQLDQVEAVPKGMNGADIVQRVFTRSGQYCGTIVWESKRTKSWSDGWLRKLKDDQRRLKAEIAVLVSEALPKDCTTFANVGGIWVSSQQCAISLATALRCQLLQVAATRAAAVGAKQKSELLYEYAASTQFRHRVESVAEAFISMHTGLQEERRATHRLWARREKQIEQVISNTAGMYGELQALAGLPDIPALTAGGGKSDDNSNQIMLQLPASPIEVKDDELKPGAKEVERGPGCDKDRVRQVRKCGDRSVQATQHGEQLG
jgi:hypothetical protein